MTTSRRQDIQEAEKEGKQVISETVRLAHETREIGRLTLDRMTEQSEQIKRTTQESDDTHRIAKDNKKVMKDLNKSWVTRLFCMPFSKKQAAAPAVHWHSDKPRIDSILSGNKKDFLKKQEKARVAKDSIPSSAPLPTLHNIEEDEDFDTTVDKGLDELASAVGDIHQLALEMRIKSEEQNVLVDNMGKSIHKTRDLIKDNDKMMAKLAPKIHKKHAKDSFISAEDRLALTGAKAIITSKLSKNN